MTAGGRVLKGGADPLIEHVDPARDADHYPRVVPGQMRGRWAACAECRGSVRAHWAPGPELRVGEPAPEES